jgi:hypothetical protein
MLMQSKTHFFTLLAVNIMVALLNTGVEVKISVF